MIFPRGSPFPPIAHMRCEGEERRGENERDEGSRVAMAGEGRTRYYFTVITPEG